MALVDGRVGDSVTFGELHDKVQRAAAGLYSMGIARGTRVTWQLPTRIETVVVSLALSRLGAVQNPVVPIYRNREVRTALLRTAAEFVINPGTWRGFDYDDMTKRLLEDCADQATVLSTDKGLPAGDPSSLPPPQPDGDSVTWRFLTSGTTSEPKVVEHSDSTLLAGGIAIADAIGACDADVTSIPLPRLHTSRVLTTSRACSVTATPRCSSTSGTLTKPSRSSAVRRHHRGLEPRVPHRHPQSTEEAAG